MDRIQILTNIYNMNEMSKTKMMTFKGHYFGTGSALSRSLSLDQDAYFEVNKLENQYVKVF